SLLLLSFFFSSRRRHTRFSRDWSSDVCSSDLIQELGYVDFVTSISQPGLSQITVEMHSTLRKQQMPQVWDELRRKVNDTRKLLQIGRASCREREKIIEVAVYI